MKSRVEAVAINSTFGIAQKIITVFANLAIQIIFVRTLGAEYAGISSLFTSILTVLSFAELGIGTAITYNLYKPIANHDTDLICSYMRFYSKAYNIVALVVFTAGVLCCPLLPYLIKDVPDITENITIIYLLFVVDTAVSYLLIYKATFLNACQENYISAVVHTATIIAKTAAISVFLLVWRNYYAYLIFTIAATFSQNIIISYIADKKYPFLKNKHKFKLPKEEVKRVYKDVYAMSLYKVSGTVLNGTDNIVISGGLGTVYVGLLSNYNLLVRQVYDTVVQFFSAATSSIGNLSTEENPEYEHKIFETLNFISFWIFMFCSVSVFVVANPFIALAFGPEYVFSLAIVFTLVADLYVKGMMNPVSSFRTSHGLFVQGKYRPLIMAILNLVISIVLLKTIGLIGVFLGTIISRVLTQVWFDPYIVYKYVFKKSAVVYFVKFLGWLAISVFIGAVTLLVAQMIPVQSLVLTIIIRMILCLVIPNVLVIAIFFKTEEFKKTIEILKHLLGKILSRFHRKGKSKC